jgi:hypothetical protein
MMNKLYYVPNKDKGDKSDFSIRSAIWYATINGKFHVPVTSP